MMSKKMATAMILSLAVGAVSFPGSASGQLPSASTAALATANNYTALARGFTAIALNPAGLAMPGNPGFSMSFPVFPVEARAGLNAISISEIAEFDGIALPAAKREEWLTSVTADLRKDTGDALVLGAGSHVGMGVEFRGVSFLPLRGGFSRVSGGAVHLAGGLGLELGPVHFSAAYLTEKNSAGEFRAASFALSFAHN